MAMLLQFEHRVLRWLLPLATVALAVLVKEALLPVIHAESPFLLFFAAIMFSAWRGGTAVGVATTLVAALCADYFFLQPINSVFVGPSGQYVRLALFAGEGMLVSLLCGQLRRSQHALASRIIVQTATLEQANAQLQHELNERVRIESALRESEARFRQFAEYIDDAFWTLEPQTRQMLYVSPAADRVWGRPGAQLATHPDRFLEWIHPDDRNRVKAALSQQYEGVYNQEYRTIWPDGSLHWVWSRAFPVKNEQGEILRIVGISRTITERKAIEQQLRCERDRYEALLQNLSDLGQGVLIGVQSKVLFANPAISQISGYSQAELLELNPLDLLVPEEQATARQRLALLQQVGSVGTYTTVMRHKAGHAVHVEIVSQTVMVNDVQQRFSVVRDVSARVEADQALRQSEAHFRELLESLAIGIVVHNPQADIVLSNPAAGELLGLSTEQLAGRTPFDPEWAVIHQDGRPFPGPTHPAPQALHTGKPVRDVVMGVRRPLLGDRIWLLVSAHPQSNPDGSVKQVVVTLSDISARVQAETQIARALHEKEILLKEIHHRVKNNLQVVASLLRLQAQATNDLRTRARFATSQQRVRAMALVHEHLYRSSSLTTIDLPHYVRQLVAQLVRLHQELDRGVQLELDVAELHLDLDAAIACGLIINELVSNSLKHAFPNQAKGSIRIAMQPDTKGYCLEIGDTGVGMPADVDHTCVQTLGLQIVGDLVAQLNGTLSLATDRGTAWTIRIPHELPLSQAQ